MDRVNSAEWAALIRQDVLKMSLGINPGDPSSASGGTRRSRRHPWPAAEHLTSMSCSARRSRRHPWPAESFSVIDILAVLYLEILRHRPDHPAWPDRDWFVQAKSSAWPAHACVLARLGYFPPEQVRGAPDMNAVPGVDFSSTCDGAGLAAAMGMCLGLRLDNKPAHVFALLGSSDMDSGGLWESAARAAREKLHRLCVIAEQCHPADRYARESGSAAPRPQVPAAR